MADMRMSLIMGLEGAEGITVTMCTSFLTKVMQTQQVIFSITQRFAGVLLRSRQQLQHTILKQLVRCWQRQSFKMAPSLQNLNVLARVKSPIDILSI